MRLTEKSLIYEENLAFENLSLIIKKKKPSLAAFDPEPVGQQTKAAPIAPHKKRCIVTIDVQTVFTVC